jgi:hypothetical protein
MAQSTPNSLKTILTQENSTLGQILAKVQFLQSLTQHLREFVAPSIGQHCCVANLRDNCLIIQVTNAAVATHLQYQSTELLSKFRTKGNLPSLANIKVIIRPSSLE